MLLNRIRNRTFIRISVCLRLQRLARGAKTSRFHRSLQHIAFPTEDVIAMLTIAGPTVLSQCG